MNKNSNQTHQAQARARVHTGGDAPGGARMARTSCYTCTMHPGIVRDASHECPQCGATLIPMNQAIVRAAIALRSLSVITRSLRRYPV